jgi:hypothetical protein
MLRLSKFVCIIWLIFSPTLSIGQPFMPGETYFSADGYIEYRCGNMPLIISSPHGGYLQPAEIPDRTCSNAVHTMDANTMELAYEVDSAFVRSFGCRPHVIICHLHRKKLDANRNLAQGACGNAQAEAAWQAFHGFINEAKTQTMSSFGKGFYLDLHGHGHSIQRIELGYLLYEEELAQSDEVVNSAQYINWSSLKNLANNHPFGLTHSSLLRGPEALGTRLHQRGYPSVPSEQDPYPLAGQPYFSGGYNTVTHSSYQGGSIDGVQMECNMNGIRDSQANRRKFADSLAISSIDFLQTHYFYSGEISYCFGLNVKDSTAEAEAFLIFPNPFRESIGIRAGSSYSALRVFDSTGRELIFQQKSQVSINVSSWPPGLYFFVFENHDGLISISKGVKLR